MGRPHRYECCDHCTHSPLPPGFKHYEPCGVRCRRGSKPLTAEELRRALDSRE